MLRETSKGHLIRLGTGSYSTVQLIPILLYSTVFYCILLYSTVFYCILLYSIVQLVPILPILLYSYWRLLKLCKSTYSLRYCCLCGLTWLLLDYVRRPHAQCTNCLPSVVTVTITIQQLQTKKTSMLRIPLLQNWCCDELRQHFIAHTMGMYRDHYFLWAISSRHRLYHIWSLHK
jgi:hypothetical protein